MNGCARQNQIDFFVWPSGFEGICSLIIEQQISVKAANSIRKRVFGLMNRVCAHDFLANDPKYFKLAGLSGPKIKYLINLRRGRRFSSSNCPNRLICN